MQAVSSGGLLLIGAPSADGRRLTQTHAQTSSPPPPPGTADRAEYQVILSAVKRPLALFSDGQTTPAHPWRVVQPSLDDGYNVARGDRAALGDVELGHRAGAVRDDLVLHLHRLDDADQ